MHAHTHTHNIRHVHLGTAYYISYNLSINRATVAVAAMYFMQIMQT